jgi:hypothetical protein
MPRRHDTASTDKNDTVTHPVAWGVMTAFLRTGKDVDHASSVLLLGTLLLYSARFSSCLSSLVMLLALLLALVEKYFAWRVALDAELFALLGRAPDETRVFDKALAASLGRKPVVRQRTVQSRWLGAKRYLRYQGVACVSQALIMSALIVLEGFM